MNLVKLQDTKLIHRRASLAVQGLRLRASTVGGAGFIPSQGTKIPQTTLHGQKKKKLSGKIVFNPQAPEKYSK